MCCLCYVWTASPAHAQWYRHMASALHSWKPTAFSSSIHTTAAQSLEQQVSRQIHQQQMSQMQKSVVRLVANNHPLHGSLDSELHSAFIIEENYKGKKFLWGVTAAHYLLTRPAIEVQGMKHPLPISMAAAGAPRYTDIALFLLPDEAAPYVTPLQLASDDLQPGELLTSYGYYGKGFHQLEHRQVQQISPSRITTSYEFGNDERNGACGGPVLNRYQEVVGVHCGSDPFKKKSFVIPVQHIRDLWTAYHHRFDGRPLLLNGKEIYRMAANEAVLSVLVFRSEKRIFSVSLRSTDADIDLEHLETIPKLAQGDTLILLFERVPFQRDKNSFHTLHFQLKYNLQNGEVTFSTVQ